MNFVTRSPRDTEHALEQQLSAHIQIHTQEGGGGQEALIVSERTPGTHLFQQGHASKSFPSSSSWHQVRKHMSLWVGREMRGIRKEENTIKLYCMKTVYKNYFCTSASEFYFFLRVILLYVYVCLCECVPQCVGTVRDQKRAVELPELELGVAKSTWQRCWPPSSGSLEEQQILVISEPAV